MKFPLCALRAALALPVLALSTPVLAQDDPNALYDDAVREAQRGDVGDAIALFRQVVALEPEWSDAVYNIADLARQTDGFPDCAFFFRRYLYLEPEDGEADTIRGHIDACEAAMTDAGRLTIAQTVPENVPIAINGAVLGAGAFGPIALPAGSHRITATRPDFEPYAATVELASGAALEHTVTLSAIVYYGNVTLDISVPGASISRDGVGVGSAPLGEPLRLAEGRYLIEVSAPGHHPWRRYIEVHRDDEQHVRVELIDESVDLDDL